MLDSQGEKDAPRQRKVSYRLPSEKDSRTKNGTQACQAEATSSTYKRPGLGGSAEGLREMGCSRSEIGWCPGVQRLFPGQSALEKLSRPGKAVSAPCPDQAPASSEASHAPAARKPPSIPARSEPAEFLAGLPASLSVPPTKAPIVADSQPTNSPPFPTPLLPTFLVALGFGHRVAATCGGRRCCLLGPRWRGGLWDGLRGLPSRVPEPICAAARLSLPPARFPVFPRRLLTQVGDPRVPSVPPKAVLAAPTLWFLGGLRTGACRAGGGRGPGSYHGGGGGGGCFPILAVGRPAYPCGRGLRRPSGQV